MCSMWQDTQRRLHQALSTHAAQDRQLRNKDQELSRHQSGMRGMSEQRQQYSPCVGAQASVKGLDIDQKMDFTCHESEKCALVFSATLTLGVGLSKFNVNAMVGSGSNFYCYKAVIFILFAHQTPSYS